MLVRLLQWVQGGLNPGGKKKKDYSAKMQSKKVLLYVLHISALQEISMQRLSKKPKTYKHLKIIKLSALRF